MSLKAQRRELQRLLDILSTASGNLFEFVQKHGERDDLVVTAEVDNAISDARWHFSETVGTDD